MGLLRWLGYAKLADHGLELTEDGRLRTHDGMILDSLLAEARARSVAPALPPPPIPVIPVIPVIEVTLTEEQPTEHWLDEATVIDPPRRDVRIATALAATVIAPNTVVGRRPRMPHCTPAPALRPRRHHEDPWRYDETLRAPVAKAKK